jgi:hypothetical protein
LARRRTTRHHIVPQSRIVDGRDKDLNNIVTLDDSFHKAWHKIFENLTVDEAIAMIRIVMISGKHWTHTDLSKLRNRMRRNP